MTKNQQTLIAALPITTNQTIMEQYARMDYVEDDGVEMYATFAPIGEGQALTRITAWAEFEQAWEDYLFLFNEQHPAHIQVDEELLDLLLEAA